MKWTVPNLLTVFRLLAAPAVLLVFLVLPRPWADWTAMILFIGGSLTDWVDGHLARTWNQQSKLGAMLDPIADKAMVITALAAVIALAGIDAVILLPAAVILFREVFVSGLREYLGDTAGTLKVTRLAKWKTTIQMVAIAVLLLHGVFAHHVSQMPEAGGWIAGLSVLTKLFGGVFLWLAALLTAVTGWDYFTKSLPYLKD